MYSTDIYNGYLTGYERELAIEDAEIDNTFSRFDTMWEMVNLEYEQNIRDAELKVFKENGTYDDLLYLYQEAENAAAEKKQGILSKILSFIADIFNTIGGWFDKISGAPVPPDAEQPEVLVTSAKALNEKTSLVGKVLSFITGVISSMKLGIGKLLEKYASFGTFLKAAAGAGLVVTIVEALGLKGLISDDECKDMEEGKTSSSSVFAKFKKYFTDAETRKKYMRPGKDMKTLAEGVKNSYNNLASLFNNTKKAVDDAEKENVASSQTAEKPDDKSGGASATQTPTGESGDNYIMDYDIFTEGDDTPAPAGTPADGEQQSKPAATSGGDTQQPASAGKGKDASSQPAATSGGDTQQPASAGKGKDASSQPAATTNNNGSSSQPAENSEEAKKGKNKLFEFFRLALTLIKDIFLLPFRFVVGKLMGVFKLGEPDEINDDESGENDAENAEGSAGESSEVADANYGDTETPDKIIEGINDNKYYSLDNLIKFNEHKDQAVQKRLQEALPERGILKDFRNHLQTAIQKGNEIATENKEYRIPLSKLDTFKLPISVWTKIINKNVMTNMTGNDKTYPVTGLTPNDITGIKNGDTKFVESSSFDIISGSVYTESEFLNDLDDLTSLFEDL